MDDSVSGINWSSSNIPIARPSRHLQQPPSGRAIAPSLKLALWRFGWTAGLLQDAHMPILLTVGAVFFPMNVESRVRERFCCFWCRGVPAMQWCVPSFSSVTVVVLFSEYFHCTGSRYIVMCLDQCLKIRWNHENPMVPILLVFKKFSKNR
jgi:hypothetical protein